MPDEKRRENCPNCGARSGGRMVAWRLLDVDDEVEVTERSMPVHPSRGIEVRGGAVVLEKEKERIRVIQETHQMDYRCDRCHNAWSTKSALLREMRLEP